MYVFLCLIQLGLATHPRLIPEISTQLKNYHSEVDGIGDVLNQHSPAVAFGLLWDLFLGLPPSVLSLFVFTLNAGSLLSVFCLCLIRPVCYLARPQRLPVILRVGSSSLIYCALMLHCAVVSSFTRASPRCSEVLVHWFHVLYSSWGLFMTFCTYWPAPHPPRYKFLFTY